MQELGQVVKNSKLLALNGRTKSLLWALALKEKPCGLRKHEEKRREVENNEYCNFWTKFSSCKKDEGRSAHRSWQ